MVICSGCNNRRGISRVGNGGIGIGAEKNRAVREKAVYWKPHMELPGDKQAVVNPYMPDPRCRVLETHKDKLASWWYF